jgi:hypothetical protein
MTADQVRRCLGLLAPSSDGSTTEEVVAILIQHEHQIPPTEFASLAQFDSKDLGLTYRKFRARKSVSVLIGENFRTVKDMEEVSHRLPIIRTARVSSDK